MGNLAHWAVGGLRAGEYNRSHSLCTAYSGVSVQAVAGAVITGDGHHFVTGVDSNQGGKSQQWALDPIWQRLFDQPLVNSSRSSRPSRLDLQNRLMYLNHKLIGRRLESTE